MRLSRRLIRLVPDGIGRFIRSSQNRRIAGSPFFRRHPYSGRLDHYAVDWRTVVDLDLGVLFHRIPKVANSSLVASVAQLKSYQQARPDQAEKRALRRDLTQPSSLDDELASRADELFKFVFVRNPYDRALSAYLSKVAGNTEISGRVNAHKQPGSGGELPPNATFEQFCRFLADGGLYTNSHWAPQTDFLIFPLHKYEFVGRFEAVDTDFSTLVRRIVGTEPGVQLVSEDPSHATAASRKRTAYYTPYLYDLVYDVYRIDFETFGYGESV